MNTNQYHLLAFLPATEKWEMPPVLETLAQQLLRSGKVRINADHARNFVRLGTSDTDQTITARELTDPALVQATRAKLARHVAHAEGVHGLDVLWTRLLADLKKARGVSADKEIKVARVLVQSAHPSVIQLLLASGTELFVSYAHNVADLMAVRDWETHGTNSGMQATEEGGTAVFVSAGGDPFFEGTDKTYTTDGFPALARMVVIAGQELGHFADLKRSAQGITGRHALDANYNRMRANPIAREARLADMQTVAKLKQRMLACGLARLRVAEKGVAFYHTRYRFTPPWLFYQIYRLFAYIRLNVTCKMLPIALKLRPLPYHRHGQALELFLADMAFNLAPDAEVYRNPDPLVEEAIAVIEAVARVPQQVNKWGHQAVSITWPGLYRFYYGTIMPATMALLPNPMKPQKTSIIRTVMILLRRSLRKRPGYYPEIGGKSSKNPK